jgi:hypothetical protein
MARSTSRDATAPLTSLESTPASPRAVRRRRARYSKALAAAICRRLASGERLRAIARDPAMPSRKTLHRWLKQDDDGLFAPCPRTARPGAPSRYSRKLAETICRRLARGEPLAAIARDPRMPPRSTIRYWIKIDKDGLFAPCPRTPGKGGPPTLYSKRLAGEICRRLARGRSLASIGRDRDMAAAPTVIDWVKKDLDGFKAAYARARELGRDTLTDEIIELADDGSRDWKNIRGKGWRFNRENLARAKLRIAARRWLCVHTRPPYERGPLTIEIVRFSGEPLS